MIRFILRRQRLDESTGLRTDEYFSVEDAAELETAMRKSGSSERGYDYVSLLGVELVEQSK